MCPFFLLYTSSNLAWNSLTDRHPNFKYGDSTVVAGRGLKVAGFPLGFSNVATQFSSDRCSAIRAKATDSPPLKILVVPFVGVFALVPIIEAYLGRSKRGGIRDWVSAQ